jgi:hypothetical protein
MAPPNRRELPKTPQPNTSSVEEERRKEREDPMRPGGVNANPELWKKRREDCSEGDQPGGVRPQGEERQERRKDVEVGRLGGAGPRQELRMKRREDEEKTKWRRNHCSRS